MPDLAQPPRRQNVIWIFGDQHRGQALSYRGDPNLRTPNIDRMADQGVTFSNAIAGCPLCCPFRGSMLTSRYPHEAVPGHEYQMPPEMPTVAHAFRDHGYRTSYFGKWHVDGFHERNGRAAMHIIPPERRGGFDDWLGYENNNAQYDCWVHGNQGGEEVHYRLPGYETDALTDLFIDYLKQRAEERQGEQPGQPFFAALSVQPPHSPNIAPPEWMERHNPGRIELRPNVPRVPRIEEAARRRLAGYYAQIENLDWNIGRILDCLDRTDLIEDTHILFFSDHGDMMGSHGMFAKTNPYAESLHPPFIISGAGRSKYGKRSGFSDVPINHVDIAPTSLGLCGFEPPNWMHGANLAPVRLGGEVDAPDSAVGQLVVPTGHSNSTDRAWRVVVTDDGWKYAALEHQPWMLFNLNEDPFEQVNEAHNPRFKVQRKRLQDRLAQWLSDTGDTFALPEL